MELVIYSPTTDEFIKSIEWNHEELKTQLTNELEKYKHLVFTPETITDGKRTLADLRRFRTAIEDKRKDVKAQCMRPYMEFEKKIKELTSLIDAPIAAIDKQVKDFDEQRRTDKLAECKAYFDEKAAELNLDDFVDWENVVRAEFGNASKSMTQIREEIDQALLGTVEDLKIIDGMESPYAFEMRQVLGQTLDLQQALSKGQQLKETAEQKARFEEERKADEEKRAAEREAEALRIKEAGKEKAKEEPEVAAPKEYTLQFEVVGTHEQLMALSQFLRDSGLRYKRITEEK